MITNIMAVDLPRWQHYLFGMNDTAQIVIAISLGILSGAASYAAGFLHGKSNRALRPIERVKTSISKVITFGPGKSNPNEAPDIRVPWGNSL